jgi:hypothetical protein
MEVGVATVAGIAVQLAVAVAHNLVLEAVTVLLELMEEQTAVALL